MERMTTRRFFDSNDALSHLTRSVQIPRAPEEAAAASQVAIHFMPYGIANEDDT
jgi:hypothetical protein